MANDKTIQVKQEFIDSNPPPKPTHNHNSTLPPCLIELSSSDSDTDSSDNAKKKCKTTSDDANALLPVGFLDPLPLKLTPLAVRFAETGNKQFWKAGDYERSSGGDWSSCTGGMDHVRVHPKFLHSNATSHKWALGAFAELLDNSLDEVCNGATYVSIDMVKSKKDGCKMLLIEDDGGGMDPDKMRHCISLGYSAKSKLPNTIGQYGNGFKTSTMRLGADVIVFSRNPGTDERPTQSIGLLSYTFLKSTGKEDIVVPMLDYEKRGQDWNKMVRSSAGDWNTNVETIVQWSPFSNETDLLRQFNHMKDHGTRIFIYNLWEDDEGLLELDFDTDPHDIQIRGVNRDEKSIEMAKKYPNSKHFLTYHHSLRSYAAILYLRVPPAFRIILRGKDVEHHNIVNDMMMSQEIVYRPQSGADGISKDSNMVAVVTVGFVKDAKYHIDVQGFNVYHKNRLIKPFWRVWHPPGVQGRGVIGVLEANFVEPAHDKQGFERTTVLSRLETRLIQAQKNYWTSYSEKIGYAPLNNKKARERDTSPDSFPPSPQSNKRSFSSSGGKAQTKVGDEGYSKEHRLNGKDYVRTLRKRPSYAEKFSVVDVSDDDDDDDDDDRQSFVARKRAHDTSSTHRETANYDSPSQRPVRATRNNANSKDDSLSQLKEENLQLRERLKRKEEEILGDLLQDLQKEKERCKSLEAQVEETNRKNEELSKEQEAMIEMLSEDRQHRDIEEENLRKKLKDASNMIQQLVEKVKLLEKR